MLRFLLLFALLTGSPAFAEEVAPDADMYTVKGVAVDIKGENANTARDKAFADGSRKAFDQLAKQLSVAGKISAKNLDDATIQGMVKSFEVEKEKASTKRYIATLTFHFRPQAVAGFMEGRNIEISEDPYNNQETGPEEAIGAAVPRTAGAILILPLVRLDTRNVLFEEPTIWRRAWENYLSDAPQADLTLAEGGLDDVRVINAAEALAGLRPPLQRIMQHYNATGVLVAALMTPSLQPTPNQELSVQVARFDADGLLQGTYVVPLKPEPAVRNNTEWLQKAAAASISVVRAAMQSPTQQLQAQQPPHPNAVIIPPQGAQNTITAGTSGVTQLILTIPFALEDDWSKARNAVQSVQNVTRFDTLSMTRARAVVRVGYAGQRNDFERLLSARGYQLVAPAAADGTFLLLPQGQTITPPPLTGRIGVPAPARGPYLRPGNVYPSSAIQQEALGPPGASPSVEVMEIEDNSIDMETGDE